MQILGISPDPVDSHQAFKAKHNLPFTLLADTEKEVVNLYGVWGEKSIFGKKFNGVLRTTYVINPEGKIQHVFENVKPRGHSEQVLDYLRS